MYVTILVIYWSEIVSSWCAVAELWLDWLRDEVKYAEATDRMKVVTLFERAVKDYMCEAIF